MTSTIPVYIVDDEEVDRLIVRKRLERSEKADIFRPLTDAEDGDEFLNNHLETILGDRDAMPPLVLMDVNMPRMDGFETIAAMQELVEKGEIPAGVVVMMFTSSQNPSDKTRAEALDMVKGYIVKPLDDDDVRNIVDYYEENTTGFAA